MIILAQRGDPMPLWFPFFFVGLWVLVSYQVAQKGWAAFAARYGGAGRPEGPAFGSPYTRFNKSGQGSYGNVVRVVPSPDGLWFSTMILFRAFHPPFMIPWSCVTRVEPLSFWYFKGYRIHIQDEAGEITVRLRWTFREALLKHRPELLQKGAVLTRRLRKSKNESGIVR